MSNLLLIGCFFIVIGIALVVLLYPFRHSWRLGVFLTTLFVMVVFGGYGLWGSWSDWQQYTHQQALQHQVQAVLKHIKGPEELIQQLKVRVEAEPTQAEGWYLLGRLYASQRLWKQAHQAYLKAHRLKPNDVRIMVNEAESIWQLHQQTFTEESRQLLRTVLQQTPDQPDALALLATDAYLRHAYQEAIDYWQHLLMLLPPTSEDAMAVRKAIVKAEKQR